MKRTWQFRSLLVFPLLSLLVALLAPDVRAQCPPNDAADPRDSTFATPYGFVHDQQVIMMDEDGESPSPLQGHVRNSSLAPVNRGFRVCIAFESDFTPTNGMYLVRYTYDDGRPICGFIGVPSLDTDFPIRMDDSTTEGLHRHVSLAMRRVNEFQEGFDYDYFASWVATPTTSGAKSRLLQFAAPQDSSLFVFNATTFVEVAIGGSNTEDIAPSSAVSGPSDGLGGNTLHWESAFSNDLRSTTIFPSSSPLSLETTPLVFRRPIWTSARRTTARCPKKNSPHGKHSTCGASSRRGDRIRSTAAPSNASG